MKSKLKKRDADLKRALQRISELETRVAGKSPKNGKLPHYKNHPNRRLNLNLNVKTISLTSLDGSSNDESSTPTSWQIESFETAVEDLSSAPERENSQVTSPPPSPQTPNGPPSSPSRKPLLQKQKSVQSGQPREVIVPGISINGEVQQEQSTYTWLTPRLRSQPSHEEVASSSHSESDAHESELSGRKLLSAQSLDSNRSSAASQSGDISDGSMLSDVSRDSIDSDF